MSVENSKTDLHLPNLSISSFRGFNRLNIPTLGRVTLLAGKNGVGKTTVLDAVRIYAARGRYSALHDVLERRDELTMQLDEDGNEILAPDWATLFYGREVLDGSCLSIGPENGANPLKIKIAPINGADDEALLDFFPDSDMHILRPDSDMRLLRVEFENTTQNTPFYFTLDNSTKHKYRIPRRRPRQEFEPHPQIPCESLGPALLNNIDLARFWDNVALTEDENRAVEALNLVLDDEVERVAAVNDDRTQSQFRRIGRRIVVKTAKYPRPVSLKSLGDGATRLFGTALALANCRDGFVLIDEVDNGLHYSALPDFWRLVLNTAQQYNVQVLATTHGWDCIAGFAKAVCEIDSVEGLLLRMDREHESIKLVPYSEDQLEIAAKQGIEVR